MKDDSPFFTQVDISAGLPTAGRPAATAELTETNVLLRELLVVSQRQNELLTEILGQVSLQHRQRAAELKAWKESNPQLAKSCRKAAESLARVHTDFLSTIALEAAENAEDFSDSEYALGEFIDRYGPRLAHFNGVLQLFAQLGSPLPQPSGQASEG
ncbi:MAG: hypothetical protein FJ284_01980 [Planctomycetes bacterium]|nr:hypothetical protein [Planctomycetota bacterium]